MASLATFLYWLKLGVSDNFSNVYIVQNHNVTNVTSFYKCLTHFQNVKTLNF